MEKNWTLNVGEFRPAYDRYNSGKLERCVVWIDPAGKILSADTESLPNSTTFRLYNGQEYKSVFGSQDGYYPTQWDVEDYLATGEAVSLLDRIFEGYSERWNGQNFIGKLVDDAQEALEALLNHFAALCTTPKTVITAEEVFAECREECLTFASCEDVAVFSASLEDDGYYLDSAGDLWEMIQEAQEEENRTIQQGAVIERTLIAHDLGWEEDEGGLP